MRNDRVGVGPDGKIRMARTGIPGLDSMIDDVERIANLPVEAKPFLGVAFAAMCAALLRMELVHSPLAKTALSVILAEVSNYMDSIKPGVEQTTEGPGSKVLSMAEFIRRSPKGRGGESY